MADESNENNGYQRKFNDNMLEWRGEVKAVLRVYGVEIEKLRDRLGTGFWLKIIALVSGIITVAALINQHVL